MPQDCSPTSVSRFSALLKRAEISIARLRVSLACAGSVRSHAWRCEMTYWTKVVAIATVLAGVAIAASQKAPHDPGPRPGPTGAGGVTGYYLTLNAAEQEAFANGIAQFVEDEGVPDQPPGTGNGGLGPGFNSTSCGSCHSQPAMLGSSPGPNSPQVPQPNPQIAVASAMGATNIIPSFITVNGPVREARFIRNADGTPPSGVPSAFRINLASLTGPLTVINDGMMLVAPIADATAIWGFG